MSIQILNDFLPMASTSEYGSVKVGDTLEVSGNGALNIKEGKALPSQTGHANQFLTTNGTDASWATVVSTTITYW